MYRDRLFRQLKLWGAWQNCSLGSPEISNAGIFCHRNWRKRGERGFHWYLSIGINWCKTEPLQDTEKNLDSKKQKNQVWARRTAVVEKREKREAEHSGLLLRFPIFYLPGSQLCLPLAKPTQKPTLKNSLRSQLQWITRKFNRNEINFLLLRWEADQGDCKKKGSVGNRPLTIWVNMTLTTNQCHASSRDCWA